MDRKRQKLTPEKDYGLKECRSAKVTGLEKKLICMEKKLKLVTAELELVKEERARDKLNFETEKCKWESKIDKYKEQCSKLQNENERLQKYLQYLETENINVDEKSKINLSNTDLSNQIIKVNETNDDTLDINSLPDEIIVEVFSYLKQKQLGQIAQVCRRWNVLTKSPVLWKIVNMKFLPSHGYQTTVAESFINTLPSCVTSIRLHFSEYKRYGILDFVEICVKLQEKCPRLQEFILTNIELSHSLPAVVYLCTQFLQDVKNLVFHHCLFPLYHAARKFGGISKIEVLDLFNCYFDCCSKSPFSKMPHLKQLYLNYTFVHDSWFEDNASFLNQLQVLDLGGTRISARFFPAIQNHGDDLKELYLCSLDLQDNDLTVTDSVFPHLKTICLSHNYVTCECVVSFIRSCPSLENVYIDEDVAESYAVHPYAVANRSKSGIVKAINWYHIHNVDYSCT